MGKKLLKEMAYTHNGLVVHIICVLFLIFSFKFAKKKVYYKIKITRENHM